MSLSVGPNEVDVNFRRLKAFGALTVSRALVKEEVIPLVRELRGALFSDAWAICTILRNTAERFSGPKETAWKESGILAFML